MKNLFSISLLLVTLISGPIANAQKFAGQSVERTDGTAFFTVNRSNGQLAFMLDYGSNAGIWKNYGGTIRESGKNSLSFHATERTDGSAFFAMDETGQMYFMLDYGSNAGVWKSYGGLVPGAGERHFEFEVEERTDGTAFFAIDTEDGQLYFLLDYGSNAGNWKAYGGTIE